MPVYWGFLGLSVILYLWCNSQYRVVEVGNYYEKRAYWIQAIVFFSVIVFFCGLRSGIADTGVYIHMFNGYPDNLGDVVWDDTVKDKGFYIFSVLYKQFVSTDFQGWLFLIALISGYATMAAFQKYSDDFGLTCYLFIATTTFTYLINGMRQYICISLLLLCTEWIAKRKIVPYIIVVLILSTIHASAIIFIPLYFLIGSKPWSLKMWLCILVAIIIGLNFETFFLSFGNLLEETQYEGYISYIAEQGVGSNIIRLILSMVPVILALIGRDIVEDAENPIIDIAINMTVINACLYFIATFSSGMVIGRLTAYFDIYNLILLPWLLNNIFTERTRKAMIFLCAALYALYFYYQMVLTWNLVYESKFLGLYM